MCCSYGVLHFLSSSLYDFSPDSIDSWVELPHDDFSSFQVTQATKINFAPSKLTKTTYLTMQVWSICLCLLLLFSSLRINSVSIPCSFLQKRFHNTQALKGIALKVPNRSDYEHNYGTSVQMPPSVRISANVSSSPGTLFSLMLSWGRLESALNNTAGNTLSPASLLFVLSCRKHIGVLTCRIWC